MAMSAEERQQMLLTQPVEKIIPKMALPTICSMLITSIYNMADTYFVSQLGTSAAGAVGVVFVAAALKEVLVLAQEVPEGDIHAFCAVGRGSRNGVRRCAGFRDGRNRLRL